MFFMKASMMIQKINLFESEGISMKIRNYICVLNCLIETNDIKNGDNCYIKWG